MGSLLNPLISSGQAKLLQVRRRNEESCEPRRRIVVVEVVVEPVVVPVPPVLVEVQVSNVEIAVRVAVA